jgi:mannose-1-phosphate guanylyltransferase
MKALLLAAGLGTRLRPLTFHCAKASLPLLNVPFLKYPLQFLRSQNIESVVVNLHAHPDSVQNIAGTSYNEMHIDYSHEPQILGTAGAIRKASQFLSDQPFVVLNGDMLIDVLLDAVIQQHVSTEADVTLVIAKHEQFPAYSSLYFDDTNSPPMWVGLQPLESSKKYHYCGVQIVSPRLLSSIPEDRKTEVFRDIYPQLAANRKIFGFVYDGLWMEVGNLREYLRTSVALLDNPLPPQLSPEGINGLISSKAIIEEGAVVSESIIMEGARIESGITIEHSIVGQDVTVSRSRKNVALARGILPWYFDF